MSFVDWYYAPTGPGQIADIVSHQPGVRAELKDTANSMARRAAALLDALPKRRTGDSQVQVTSGALDYFVMLSDPLGRPAAASIDKRFGILRQVS